MTSSRFFSGWVRGLIAALVVVALALFGWVLLAPPGAEEGAPPAQPATAPEATPPPPDAAAPAQPPAKSTEPEPAAPEQPQAPVEPTEPEAAAPVQPHAPVEPMEPEAAAPLAPAFDVVRIKRDGSALVAGRAEPGAVVSVLVEGVAVARTEADASADFVAMFTLPPLETDRVMTLEAVLADGTRLASEMNVIVEGVALPEVVAEAETAPEPLPVPVPEPEPGLEPELETVTAPTEPEPEPGLEVRPEPELGPEPGPEIEPVKEPAPAPQPEASTVPDVGAEAPLPSMPEAPATTPGTDANQAPPAPVSPSAPPPPTSAPTTAPATGVAPATPAPAPAPEPEAPRILLAGPDGIRVLQDSSPRPQLSIDAISYDDAGEVALAGRGQGAETLRIYLDNAPVGTAEVGPGGDWRAPLPDVDAGVYTLRVDSLSAEGEVTSRVETPFKREAPAVLAAAGEKAAEAVAGGRMLAAITVQPGHTLWAIAEGRYGEGIAYWTIFGANRDQIRDPDWIYPGQVFTLPDAAQ